MKRKSENIYLNHFALQQKLTPNCKSTILQKNIFFKRLSEQKKIKNKKTKNWAYENMLQKL